MRRSFYAGYILSYLLHEVLSCLSVSNAPVLCSRQATYYGLPHRTFPVSLNREIITQASFHQVAKLDLDLTRLEDECLRAFAESSLAGTLKEIRITNVHFTEASAVVWVSFRELEVLHLGVTAFFPLAQVLNALSKMSTLREISLRYPFSIRNQLPMSFLEILSALLSPPSALPNLRVCDLNGIRKVQSGDAVLAALLVLLKSRQRPELLENVGLRYAFPRSLTLNQAQQISQVCPNMPLSGALAEDIDSNEELVRYAEAAEPAFLSSEPEVFRAAEVSSRQPALERLALFKPAALEGEDWSCFARLQSLIIRLEVFASITLFPPRLTTLHIFLFNLSSTDERAASQSVPALYRAISSQLPSLRDLAVSVTWNQSDRKGSVGLLQDLLQSLTALEELSLKHPSSEDEQDDPQHPSFVLQVRHERLKELPQLDIPGMNVVFMWLPGLRALDIHPGKPDHPFSNIQAVAPNLSCFYLSSDVADADDGSPPRWRTLQEIFNGYDRHQVQTIFMESGLGSVDLDFLMQFKQLTDLSLEPLSAGGLNQAQFSTLLGALPLLSILRVGTSEVIEDFSFLRHACICDLSLAFTSPELVQSKLHISGESLPNLRALHVIEASWVEIVISDSPYLIEIDLETLANVALISLQSCPLFSTLRVDGSRIDKMRLIDCPRVLDILFGGSDLQGLLADGAIEISTFSPFFRISASQSSHFEQLQKMYPFARDP